MEQKINKAILEAMQLISANIGDMKMDFSLQNQDVKIHPLKRGTKKLYSINIVIEEQV